MRDHWFEINWSTWLNSGLPRFLRFKPVLLDFVWAITSALRGHYSAFKTWRRDANREVLVNAQTLVLEAYLQRVFGGLFRIVNHNEFDTSIYIPLTTNDTDLGVFIPLNEHALDIDRVYIYTEGEFIDAYDFTVYVPEVLDDKQRKQVRAICERLVAASSYFNII